MSFVPQTAWGEVAFIIAGSVGSVFSVIAAVRSKHAVREASAANKAVNGNPVGEPRAYDMLGTILEEIEVVSAKVVGVDNKLDKHLSWHQQQAQAPRSAPPSSGQTRKTVAKKPVKKVASKK